MKAFEGEDRLIVMTTDQLLWRQQTYFRGAVCGWHNSFSKKNPEAVSLLLDLLEKFERCSGPAVKVKMADGRAFGAP